MGVAPIETPVEPPRETLPGRVVSVIRRDLPLALLDAAVVVPAYFLPFILRYDGAVPRDAWHRFWIFLPAVVLMHLLANYLWGLYGQMWRHASVQEARRVALAGLTGLLLVLGADLLAGGMRPVPLSVVVLGSGLSLMAFGAIRFQSRLFAFRRRTVDDADRRRVLIMGAGDAGAQVFADLLRHASLGMEVVGLLDDDPRRRGLSLHGVSVLGGRERIPSLSRELHIDQVLLAIPTATSDLIRDVVELCEEADVSLRVLPSVREIVGGRVSARDLRALSIEDLLGRQQVETDLRAVRELLRGKRVLITGAGGSIGSEISRQVCVFDPAELLVLDNDETHLHDLIASLPVRATSILADVRDRVRVDAVFAEHSPQVVFHAAAHKHVPILEEHPEEAFTTNIMGTANVAEAAVAAGTARFVLISTDKAVHPASVMGASKQLAEEVVRSLDGRSTAFCAVRFGNVLGSRGSVVPTFLRQIEAGGPVTVTDPEMTRYFMSIAEAVQLVLQASAMARGGDVFTLEMGEPMKIMDLANRMIRLSGRVPGRDISVEIVGRRPGEKYHEELVDDEEHPLPSGHPDIVVAYPPTPDPAALRWRLRDMASSVAAGSREELFRLMKERRSSDVQVGSGVVS
jgi:FlaA1/EpsC-like NDP-sugar epimerase